MRNLAPLKLLREPEIRSFKRDFVSFHFKGKPVPLVPQCSLGSRKGRECMAPSPLSVLSGQKRKKW